MGILRQKCVQTYDTFLNSSNSSTTGFNMSYESYIQEINNESMFIDRLISQRFIIFLAYWYQEAGVYILCGNASGSRRCPNGYVCWKDRGIK